MKTLHNTLEEVEEKEEEETKQPIKEEGREGGGGGEVAIVQSGLRLILHLQTIVSRLTMSRLTLFLLICA